MSSRNESFSSTDWRKSRRSVNNGACVAVASIAENIAVKDSVGTDGRVLIYSADAWRSFTASLKIPE